MKFILSLLTTLFFSFQVFAQSPLNVAVAANLSFPLEQIKKEYESKSNEQINLIVASSGVLTAQINNGAPYAIFLSADMKYPETLYKAGKTNGNPQVLVKGKLVLWSKKQVAEREISNLLKESKTIAVAQPKLAPYGQAAKEWLEIHNLYQAVASKLVYGESISQVNRYIAASSVDVAFASISAMFSAELKDKGYWLPLETDATSPLLDHGMVVLKPASKQQQQTNQFVKYLKSEEAKAIFQKFGYVVP